MARVLAISSFVASGHVGLSAVIPALQHFGHEVVACPTILLSNHPGHTFVHRHDVPAADGVAIVEAISANGWLAGCDAVLTGYLPTASHVAMARSAIETLRGVNPAARVICDPVLGDDPKGLYIDSTAALAIRDQLLPVANLMTPNRFELEWLTGKPVGNVQDAAAACRAINVPVVATSVPVAPASIATALFEPGQDRETALHITAKRKAVPHGTGDLLTGLLTAYLLNGMSLSSAVAAASAALDATILASAGQPELSLAASRKHWVGSDHSTG